MSQNAILSAAEDKMKKTEEAVRRDLTHIRTGKASPSLLDAVHVEYYGTNTPLRQIAAVSAPEARLLVVQPYDLGSLGAIEKGIQKAGLGLNPANDGKIIRVPIPELTEERRKELVKVVRHTVEEGRVAIRNIRRDSNDHLKKAEKDGSMAEDEHRHLSAEIQKLTDQYVKELDQILSMKEKEILEV